VGLPIEGTDRWDIYAPLLDNPALKPSPQQITNAASVFREFLQIRKSSSLFRLTTEQQVIDTVSFLNTGPEQIPGLIVMRLVDVEKTDPNYSEILVFFNANPDSVSFNDSTWINAGFTLHPVLVNSADPIASRAAFNQSAGTFSIPPLTTSVFVWED
jgi:hypothetical protein